MSNQVEFRHLRYFQALAQELHFHRAADKLFISQPGLSRQIQQLEQFVGTQLFERDKKHVALTHAGAYFQKESNFLLNSLENMVEETRNIASGTQGELRIGFVGSAMQNIIPELILKSTNVYPNLSFSFEEMRNSRQIERLLVNDIDLGFVRLDDLPAEINSSLVYEDTFSLVLPEDHPIDDSNFQSIRQLSEEPYILFHSSYSPTYHNQIISICQDQGFTPRIVHNSVHASTIYRLVENGLGISIVPSALKDGYDMKVKFIELSQIKQRAQLLMVWSKKNRNPSLKKVLEIIDSKIKD